MGIRKKRISDERLAYLAKTRTLYEIADVTGYTHSYVALRLRTIGVKAVRKKSERCGSRKRVPDEKLAELAPTHSMAEIAILTGYSYENVAARLKKMGVKAARKGQQREIALDAKTKAARDIANLTGYHPDYVYDQLKPAEARPDSKPDSIDDEIIFYMKETGHSFRSIALGLGIPIEMVRKVYYRVKPKKGNLQKFFKGGFSET